MPNFWYRVLRSFRPAIHGIISAAHERNMKVHLFATLTVCVLGVLVGLTQFEWTIVLILISLVLSAEMVNTAIEELCNIVRDELKLSYEATRRARDVAAGAVLVLALIAGILGSSIFLPKVIELFR